MHVQIIYPKFTTFSRLFLKQQFFSRRKVIKYMYYMWSKRTNKASSMTCRWDWIRFDQHKKNFTCEALVVAFKKTQDFLPFFQDFPSIFQTFSRSGKLPGQFQEFFKNSTLYEPWLYNLRLLNTNVFKFCFRPPFEQSLFLSSWSRRRKAGSSCIASNLWGCHSPNFWTFLVRASV